MKVRFTKAGWLIVIVIMIISAILGTIYGRTSYIPEVCDNLKKEYPEPITRGNPEYSSHLDSNRNGIACD